jgi:hypothetical protein
MANNVEQESLSELANWLWLRVMSVHKWDYPKPKDDFMDWWAQHRSQFEGLAESQARSIYEAGQRTIIDALREMGKTIRAEGQKFSERADRASKWRIEPNNANGAATIFEENRGAICQCGDAVDARRIVSAMSEQHGVEILDPNVCSSCGAINL